MREKFIKRLLALAAKKRSWISRLLGIFSVTLNFLVIIPWLAVRLAGKISMPFPPLVPPAIRPSVALISVSFGIFWLVWATWAQLAIGGGTPNIVAPPVRLVIIGPYRLCRNPIQLGTSFYYHGVLTHFSGLLAGLALFVISQVVASLYHRLVEEKELVRRFGREYERYRRITPFIIPRFRRVSEQEDQELAGDGHQDQGHGIDRGV